PAVDAVDDATVSLAAAVVSVAAAAVSVAATAAVSTACATESATSCENARFASPIPPINASTTTALNLLLYIKPISYITIILTMYFVTSFQLHSRVHSNLVVQAFFQQRMLCRR